MPNYFSLILQLENTDARAPLSLLGHPSVAFTPLGAADVASAGLLACPLPRRIDVEVFPRMLPVGVLLVALHPRLQQRVLDRVHTEPPRVVRGDQLRHPAIDLVALGTVRQTPRRAIEIVVFWQRKTRVVGLFDVLAVEQLRERVALTIGGDPADAPHLQLAVLAHLNQVRPLLFQKLDADADRLEALLPHLVELAIAC